MKKSVLTKSRIAVIVSRFNPDITNGLLSCCRSELTFQGIPAGRIDVFWVPGAFEIPFMAQTLAKKRKWQAIICLGCVIKGETSHDEHVARWAAEGCGRVSLEYQLPVLYGILTPNSEAQA